MSHVVFYFVSSLVIQGSPDPKIRDCVAYR